jgi:predicted Zn-dependent peptidase
LSSARWTAIKNQELIFAGNNLGKDVIGTSESIKKLSRDNFVSFRSKYFVPGRFVIGASGNFDEARFLETMEATLGKLKKVPSDPFDAFKSAQKKSRFYFEKRPTKQVNLMLSFLGKGAKDKDRFALGLLSFILGVGLSSRLFQEVRTRRGLAYAVSAAHHSFQDTGGFFIYAGVLKDKVRIRPMS